MGESWVGSNPKNELDEDAVPAHTNNGTSSHQVLIVNARFVLLDPVFQSPLNFWWWKTFTLHLSMSGQEILNPILGEGVLDPGGRLQCVNWCTNPATGEQGLLS